MIGASIVLFATWLYSSPDTQQQYTPLEKTEVQTDQEKKDAAAEEAAGKSSIDGLKRQD